MGRLKTQTLKQEEERREPMTLGDLAHIEIDVFCWCNRCSHNAIVGTARLTAELGPGYPVPEVGARMRCTSCGSRDVATRPNWPGLGSVTNHTPPKTAEDNPASTATD